MHFGEHGRRRYDSWSRGGYGGDEYPERGWSSGPPRVRSRARLWLVALVGLAVWSLFAWIGYLLVDPVLGWIAGSSGALVEGGRDIATVAGAGAEANVIVEGLNATGAVEPGIALLRAIAKPAIVLVWALGAFLLVVAPLFAPRLRGLLARRWH